MNHITSIHPDQGFVWRGQTDARWGLHSSLYRLLMDTTGSPPSESELNTAEARLLRMARTEWRLDGIPALQLFAQMQHVGAPTRLLDVTYNPLIAAWFAVARDTSADDLPARLLAFTAGEPLQLNSNWNGNTPRWHRLHDTSARRAVNWGTGYGRKIWRPPALHGRIPAQNAAFILDGVPIDAVDAAPGEGRGRSMWAADEVRRFSSVPMRLAHLREGRLPTKAPVFTYVIAPDAKVEIRNQLEQRFGHRFATIYADLEGLAEYLEKWPEVLT
ncbi:FRG domain-containing protein [Microbacterium elymi]|uniref:FRG domain-containing protein n=1 Tax=Microbacterium elymi TaxID=2909587 RepID=A0ABY5NMM8_9MICO|nr:FRG domain-containing protein [Microbacterium elymi]UUT36400.1 FRG domain-containing protein [Microbacterium elymi]